VSEKSLRIKPADDLGVVLLRVMCKPREEEPWEDKRCREVRSYRPPIKRRYININNQYIK